MAILAGVADETTEQDDQQRERGPPPPPVTEGEQRPVEIETIGGQATESRARRAGLCGHIEQGERVRIEITAVQEHVAFAAVTEQLRYDA